MGKKLTTLCIFAIVVSLALPAFAAVQNIRVGGDVTVRSVVRSQYNLASNFNSTNTNDETYFMHHVGVNLLADLTDNVSVTTRIINQRDWDNNSAGAADFDADIDLAYVTLKEMVYAPLTVTVGRQDIWLGKGFIVGAKLLDHNGSIGADEYTETAGFDAIRGTLDFDPWTIDLIYAKMDENTLAVKDDVDLYVLNTGYKFDQYNAEAEGYFVVKNDHGPQLQSFPNDATESTVSKNSVYTLGLRGSFEPELVENTTLLFEIAHQSGTYTADQNNSRDRNAWAVDFSGEKRWPDWTWTPTLGLEYIFYSGEENYAISTTGDWNAWDAVYRGKFDTAIREFQNYFYATAYRAANVGTNNTANTGTEVDMDSGLTNEHQLLLKSTFKPIRQLTAEATLATFWFDEALKGTNQVENGSKDIGKELDVLLTYDYSEDLTFNLLFAQFYPGKYWISQQDATATDVVGSVKLTF